MKRQKWINWVCLFSMALLVLAGCSKGTDSGNAASASPKDSGAKPAESAPTTAAPKKDVKLTFWVFENPPMVDQTKQLLTQFQTDNPNIKVDLQVFPNAQYNDKLLVALGTETGPDVLLASDRNIPTLTAKKVLAPVVPKAFGFNSLNDMKAEWLNGSLNGLMTGDQLYGIPMEFDTFSLFINTKMFKDAGLDPVKDAPKTWDDLANVAKKLTIRKDGKLVQAGFAWPMFNGGWDILSMDPMVRQAGGKFMDDNGVKAYFTSPEVKRVFQTWSDLYNKDKVSDMGFGTSTAAAPNQSFIDGKVAMWVSGPWAIPQITQGTPAYGNYAVVPLPQYETAKPVTMLYSWNWSVNSATKNPNESWALVNFLSSHQKEWLKSSGYIQPRKGWMDSQEFKDFPFSNVWVKNMESGSYVMRSDKYPQMGDIVGRAVDAVMKDNGSIDDALKKAQDEADKLLKK